MKHDTVMTHAYAGGYHETARDLQQHSPGYRHHSLPRSSSSQSPEPADAALGAVTRGCNMVLLHVKVLSFFRELIFHTRL